MEGNMRKGLIFVAAASICWAGPAMASTQGADAAVAGLLDPSARAAAEVVDAFHAALRRGDTEAALGLLVEDALIFEAGGVERDRAEYASHHLASDAAFSQAVPSSITRRTGEAVGDIAWIASEGRTTGTFKDRAVDRLTTETMVLRRTAAGWRIVHIHWSSAAAKQR